MNPRVIHKRYYNKLKNDRQKSLRMDIHTRTPFPSETTALHCPAESWTRPSVVRTDRLCGRLSSASRCRVGKTSQSHHTVAGTTFVDCTSYETPSPSTTHRRGRTARVVRPRIRRLASAVSCSRSKFHGTSCGSSTVACSAIRCRRGPSLYRDRLAPDRSRDP